MPIIPYLVTCLSWLSFGENYESHTLWKLRHCRPENPFSESKTLDQLISEVRSNGCFVRANKTNGRFLFGVNWRVDGYLLNRPFNYDESPESIPIQFPFWLMITIPDLYPAIIWGLHFFFTLKRYINKRPMDHIAYLNNSNSLYRFILVLLNIYQYIYICIC